MFPNKVLTAGVAALLAAAMIATGAAVYAYQTVKPNQADARSRAVLTREPPAVVDSDDGLLTVAGIVRMQDGSPAAGASVRSMNGIGVTAPAARTDHAGRFQLQGVFEDGGRLHVSSADGSYQAVLKVPSVATRTVFASSLELKLLPALTHQVTVLSQGRPAARAHVAAVGNRADFLVQGVTGEDGKVRLRLPVEEPLSELVAWHPTLGATGKRDLKNRPLERTTELSLMPPGPHTIHVIDVDGHGIGGLELGVSVRPEECDWIVAKYFQEAHVRTDAKGNAIVPWAPRAKLQYVEIDILGPGWKVDETLREQIAAGITTVHARRKQTVFGRLIMPEGTAAQGILVTGFGFGPADTGAIPSARAQRDGTFHFSVPAEHGYVLGIEDLKWASDPWTGMILGKDSAHPAEITMKVYPATPLTIRVTRGPHRDPVSDAWLELGAMANVKWTDGTGKQRSGTGGAGTWLRTDAQGLARASVGKGKLQLHLSSGAWYEERTIEITAEKPVEVEFHRSWTGQHRITGRLMSDTRPYVPSPALVAHAWAPQPSNIIPLAFEPVVQPDGTFEVGFDAESVSLFFIDREKQRSGFAESVHGDADVEIRMEAMTATYSGTLLDESDQPIADGTLVLYVKTSDGKIVAAQQTDRTGRFRFTGLPCKTPLRLGIRYEGDRPKYYLFHDRMFDPGEVRENDVLKASRPDQSSHVGPVVPLIKSVDSLCRNARAGGMRVLVALLGDDSGDTVRTIDQLFNYDNERTRAVLNYLTLRVEAGQLEREATIISEYGWPRPAPREIVLVVLNGDRKMIAAQRIAASKVATALDIGVDFLIQNKPLARNALTLLAEARREAKRSGRRVWLIDGGPRCSPCFRLARWILDQHAILDKDYVIVKLMAGIDEHVTEAVAGLPIKDGDGIPWFTITEADGTILAVSRGPLGNIGFPSSVEGIRHFRQMLDRTVQRITSEEVDRLISSLSAGQ